VTGVQTCALPIYFNGTTIMLMKEHSKQVI